MFILFNTLQNGAGWRVQEHWDEKCMEGQTITVWFNPSAGENTQKAAEALGNELVRMVPFADGYKSLNSKGNVADLVRYFGKDNPMTLMAVHPESVIIAVPPHPP